MSALEVKEPGSEFHSLFFHDGLLKAKAYSLQPSDCHSKLDQNESPFDWDRDLKESVTKALLEESWNTYPEDYPRELKSSLSDSLGVSAKNIVLSPGSNYHITVLLNLFAASQKGDIVIARPCFPLFEGHCSYQKIPYKTWDLDDTFNYNLDKLPKMSPGSCLFFASPNNPVGNSLPRESLEKILQNNPESYVVADEAYWEFVDQDYQSLLAKYSNLIMIRTFSKAMGAAGIRLSYVLGSEAFCHELSKVTLPFLVNKFTALAVVHALKSDSFMPKVLEQVNFVKKERNRIFKELSTARKESGFKILNSEANFLSLLCHSAHDLEKVQSELHRHGILVRNVSNPFLKNTLRLSIGSLEENSKVINVLKDFSSHQLEPS